MGKLQGKRIIITGSKGGFGSASMQEFRDLGAQVVGLDKRSESPDDDTIQCDVTDPGAVQKAVAEAAQRMGGVDVLINNAGIGTPLPLTEVPGDYEHATISINFMGTWNVTAAALPHLLAAKGQVINVSSMLAWVNLPYLTAYSASKRAVCALSDVLRVEHREHGLAVTTIYPGYVATAIHDHGEKASGLSLRNQVPEETVGHVVRTFVRAIERRPRDLSTSVGGNVARYLARRFPRTIDKVVARGMKRDGAERPAKWPVP